MIPSTRRCGFTLIELLVVVAIIAVLIAILLPALNKARDVSKAVVCSSQLKQLYMGSVLYASDYRNELPAPREWIDNSIAWMNSWKTPQAVKQGTLYKYVGKKDELYLCPKFLDLIPQDVTPAFCYTMNIYFIRPGLVSAKGWAGYPSLRRITDVQITTGLFLFAEESPWVTAKYQSPLNDALLAPTWGPASSSMPFLDALATYHLGEDLYSGKANAAFVDGHVSAHPIEDTHEIGTPQQYR